MDRLDISRADIPENEKKTWGNTMRTSLKLARYAIGGALLAVYAVGFFGPLMGFHDSHLTDAIAAILGGSGTLAVILKAHLITL
jgi:hypothetical protein